MSSADVVQPNARPTPPRAPSPRSDSLRKTTRSTAQGSDVQAQEASRRAYEENEKVPIGSRRTSTGTAPSTRSRQSTRSGRLSANVDRPPTPESSPTRTKRKRAAESPEGSEITDEERAVKAAVASQTHTRGSSGDSKTSAISVCLCQPEPKIPRPRNAFILYRQCNHASVASQNPGLSNPNISKIIGQQWKSQTASVKKEWKELAEEEKLRHQKQYPDYRYRPRRNERRGSISEAAGGITDLTSDDKRCAKCGGKSISATSPVSSGPSSSSPAAGVTQFPAMSVDRYLNKLRLTSPRDASRGDTGRGDGGRPRVGPHGLHINATASRTRPMEDGSSSPSTPDAKRRRYNGPQAAYVYSRPGAAPGTSYAIPAPPSIRGGIASGHVRGESLPRPSELFARSPPGTASMGPPPTPRHGQGVPRSPFPHNGNGLDRMSLTLAPIQSPSGPSKSAGSFPSAGPADGSPGKERRSIEAMVMSMSFLGKLKILHKIAPPVSANANVSGERPRVPRGAIVAVEGFNCNAVAELVDWLDGFLSRTGDHDVRVANGPKVPDWRTKAEIPDMLELVRDWHNQAREMADFVAPAETLDKIEEEAAGEDDDKMDTSKDQPTQASQSSQAEPPAGPLQRRGSAPDHTGRSNVVLLKTYALNACDRFACTIPINDSYSPADHWQWMATLWRGIPGPDIVVYVKEMDLNSRPPAAGDASEKAAANGNGNGNGNAPGALEKEKIGTVDIKEEDGLRCLVVWKERGKEIEVRALRRLGFELSEWVRVIAAAKK